MATSLTIADVERVAALAQLELTPEEKTLFTRQLADVLHYAEQIQALDTHDDPATAQVRAADIEDLGLDGTRAVLMTPQGRRDLKVPLLGRGHLMNVVCAAAVALEMGVELDVIVDRVAQLKPSSRRGAILRLPKGVTVIDDSYNSSPSALRLSLDVLSRTWAARRIAVIGEMLELGELSLQLHQECGRVAAGSRVARLITVGGSSARALGEAAIAAGQPANTVSHFDTSAEAAPAITSQVTSGDVVLVKGSRGTKTDVVVEQLMEAFS